MYERFGMKRVTLLIKTYIEKTLTCVIVSVNSYAILEHYARKAYVTRAVVTSSIEGLG